VKRGERKNTRKRRGDQAKGGKYKGNFLKKYTHKEET
jgi:hypothetical protein